MLYIDWHFLCKSIYDISGGKQVNLEHSKVDMWLVNLEMLFNRELSYRRYKK